MAQQALLKAYLSLKRFDLRSAFGTWLYKIAVNECWDYFRKKKVRPLVYEANLSDDQIRQMEGLPEDRDGAFNHPVDAARRTEQRDLLDRLLVELDEKDRTMLVMKEVGRLYGGGDRRGTGAQRKYGKGKIVSRSGQAGGRLSSQAEKLSAETGDEVTFTVASATFWRVDRVAGIREEKGGTDYVLSE